MNKVKRIPSCQVHEAHVAKDSTDNEELKSRTEFNFLTHVNRVKQADQAGRQISEQQ